jgi:hypothetical protein
LADDDIRSPRPCGEIGCAPKARRAGLCDECPFLHQSLACAVHVLRIGKCETCDRFTLEGALCPRVM